MKRSFVLLLALLAIIMSSYGCDDVCTENGGAVQQAANTKLYYPCQISSPTAATTISSGFIQGLSDIQWLSQKIAEDGYIVLALTPVNRLGMVSQWRNMHKSGVQRLKTINSSHAKLRGMISDYQVSGHSKGGGGTLWAAADLRGELTTAIAMAPYREVTDLAMGLNNITAATLIQAGGGDTLATNPMTRAYYDQLPNGISKGYFEYVGYDHVAWTSTSAMGRQGRISGDYLAWMNYYINGDTSAAGALRNAAGTALHKWEDKGPGTPGTGPGPITGPCN